MPSSLEHFTLDDLTTLFVSVAASPEAATLFEELSWLRMTIQAVMFVHRHCGAYLQIPFAPHMHR
ncbi:MAG: hypothetical protein AB7E80_17210 [Hyphomicrobiaceae bacterium]